MTDNHTYNVLVVDDNEMNRDMLSRRLAKSGYTVELAEDGASALQMLGNNHFDMVLLDIMMPGMDGTQVLQHMKQNPELRTVPVIMLTAVHDKKQVVQCLKLGAESYVVKPFDIDALKARIQETLIKKKLCSLQ